jgi:hypothetical protein
MQDAQCEMRSALNVPILLICIYCSSIMMMPAAQMSATLTRVLSPSFFLFFPQTPQSSQTRHFLVDATLAKFQTQQQSFCAVNNLT